MDTIVLLLTVVILGVLIFISVQAWRNGHRDWAWGAPLAIVGTMTLIPLVGSLVNEVSILNNLLRILAIPVILAVIITAWVKTSKPLSAPVECPECRKSSKARRRVIQDKVTSKKVPSRLVGTLSLIGGLVCLASIFIDAGISAKVTALILGVSFVGIGVPAFKPTIQKIEYKCTGCAHIFIKE